MRRGGSEAEPDGEAVAAGLLLGEDGVTVLPVGLEAADLEQKAGPLPPHLHLLEG